MAAPKPSLSPWYQFSLRSLMLLVLFVSVLCSLCVSTHSLVPAVFGLAMMLGGVAGRIVARTRSGFIEGAVVGISFSVIAIEVGILLLAFACPPEEPSWPLWFMVVLIAALVGGVLAGFEARRASKR